MHSILFCGVGGQGVLKASEICGMAALLQGFNVKKSEVHGMAQRGGSVESHLRFGEKVYSPLIMPGQADQLVCFNRGEADRVSHFLKEDGTSFVGYIDVFEKQELSPLFLNTFLLGILSSYLPIEQDYWLTALKTVFTRAQDENRTVFLKGAEVGKEQ